MTKLENLKTALGTEDLQSERYMKICHFIRLEYGENSVEYKSFVGVYGMASCGTIDTRYEELLMTRDLLSKELIQGRLNQEYESLREHISTTGVSKDNLLVIRNKLERMEALFK